MNLRLCPAIANLSHMPFTRKVPVLLVLLLAAMPSIKAQAQYGSAVLSSAWWSNETDSNGDGYKETAQLNWNADVAGGSWLSVYEKVYYRVYGSGSWTLLTSTPTHTIIGNDPDDAQYTIVTVPSRNTYDFKVEVYRSGEYSPDSYRVLFQYKMEPGSGGGTGEYTKITDAWWTNLTDVNGDGYYDKGRLNWNPDVINPSGGTQRVFEKVYFRNTGSTDWTLFLTTSEHTITGSYTSDANYLDITPQVKATLDFKIEVYLSGQTDPDCMRDPGNDSDLSAIKLAPNVTGDRVFIQEAWWTDEVDENGDGYKESARLTWNADVLNGATNQAVYEKVYYRTTGTEAWTLWVKTNLHSISGISTTDLNSCSIAPSFGNGMYDFKIEVYRSGQTTPDYSRDCTLDADLFAYMMGTGDTAGNKVTLTAAGWSNEVDLNGNGYKSSARLSWNADITGGPSDQMVYEKVYQKSSGSSTWTLLATPVSHMITAGNDNTQSLDITGKPQDNYDFKIELYRTGQTTPDSMFDGSEILGLSQYKMETFPEDDPSQAVANPTFTPDPAADYISPVSVSIATITPSATIRYTMTTDGTTPPDPTNTSTIFSSSSPITAGYGKTIIKAKGWKSGVGASAVVTATYQVRTPVHTLTRTLPTGYSPGTAVPVQITVTPDPATTNWTLADAPPAGWLVSGITQGGTWDSAAKKVTWGPFTGALPRTLSYQATPPMFESGTKSFSGTATLNGRTLPVEGNTTLDLIPDTTPPQALSITRLDTNPTSAGTVRFAVAFSEPVSGVDPADFTLAATGTLSGVQVVSLGGGPTLYTANVYTGTGEGQIRLDLNSSGTGIQDWAGGAITGGLSGGQSYLIDRQGPGFGTLGATPALARPGMNVQLQFTASEALQSSPTVTVNGHPAALQSHSGLNYTAQYAVTAADPDGAATVAITGADLAGNRTDFSSASLLMIDKVPPAAPTGLALDAADDTGYASSDGITSRMNGLTIRGTAEAGATVQLWDGTNLLGSTPAASFASPGLDIFLAEGLHNITAIATDPAGNASPASGILVVRVDLTAPTAGSASAPAYAKTSPIQVTYSGSGDTGSGLRQVELWVKANGGAWQDSNLRAAGASGSFSYVPAAEATYAFAIVAEDLAGNRSAAPSGPGGAQTLFDATLPKVLSITRLDASPTSISAARFAVTFSEPVSGVALGAFTPYASGALSGVQVAGLSGGPASYTVTVNTGAGEGNLRLDLTGYANILDLAGNGLASGYSSGQTYRIDHNAPGFGGMTASPSPAPQGAVVNLGFVATEAISTSPTVTVNGHPATLLTKTGMNYTAQYTVSADDPDGAATVTFTGRDLAGNPGIASSTTILTVDKTAPDAPSALVLAAADDTGYSNSDGITQCLTGLTLRGTAESGAVVKLWEGATLLASGNSVTFAASGLDVNLSEGLHNITVTATDAAGNVSTASEAFPLHVDQTIPTAGVASAPATAKTTPIRVTYSGAGDTGSGLHQVQLWYKLGAGAWQNSGLKDIGAAGGFDFAPPSKGTYAFAVVSEDAAGNRSATPTGGGDCQSIFDFTGPQALSINRLDATPTSASTVRFAVAFSEPVSGIDPGDLTPFVSGTLSGVQIASLSGGPASYTVAVNTGAGEGQLRLDLKASGTGIQDWAGNPLTTGFTTGQVYRIDHVAPVISALAASPARAKSGAAVSVSFTVSEALGSSPTLTVNGNAAPIQTHSGLSYTCRYTVTTSDPEGPANVVVAVVDPAKNRSTKSSTAILGIDNHAPASSVLATSSASSPSLLTIRWTSSDPASNNYASGIKTVDIYWKKDGGAAKKLGSYTPGVTSAAFDLTKNGGYGRYDFYAVATDQAGNIEAAPALSDWWYRWSNPQSAAGPAWQRYE